MSGKPLHILQRDELLALAAKPAQGSATAFVMSLDETTSTPIPLDYNAPLPLTVGGWSVQGLAVFADSQAFRFPLDKVAQSVGSDSLYVELRATVSRDKEINVKGIMRVVLIDGSDKPILAHMSNIDAIGCTFVTLSPANENRDEHPRTSDGRRIAGIACDGLPPILLHILAQREQPQQADPQRDIVVMPIVNGWLPNTPTSGEGKRRRRIGKANSTPFSVITQDRMAKRVPVAVVVKLDEESMRLADNSHTRHRTTKRSTAIQMIIPYPTAAKTSEEIQEAVQRQLQHFDTDYLLSFDAITAILVDARDEATGTALDETLQRKVVAMRFGSTHVANPKQRQRIRDHFETLMQVRIEVVSQTDSKAFRGSILLRTGEFVDLGDGTIEPFKLGDCIMLNPSLYCDIAYKGKGMYVDTRYFQFDPCHNDWHLRLYRYLASRWSASSTKLVSNDWTLRLQLHTVLDMSGIDWRTKAHGQGRGEVQARRKLDDTLGHLEREGMIGAWSIDGDGMSDSANLTVKVPEVMQARIVERRPGLHADAVSGALQARTKREPKAIRKAR